MRYSIFSTFSIHSSVKWTSRLLQRMHSRIHIAKLLRYPCRLDPRRAELRLKLNHLQALSRGCTASHCAPGVRTLLNSRMASR